MESLFGVLLGAVFNLGCFFFFLYYLRLCLATDKYIYFCFIF